jgi:hypothetical protein
MLHNKDEIQNLENYLKQSGKDSTQNLKKDIQISINNSSGQITPEGSDYVVNKIFEKIKNEVSSGISKLNLLSKNIFSMDEFDYPFKKGTNIHNFHINIFPYFKILSVLLIVLVSYCIIKSMLWVVRKKEGNINILNS